MWNDLIVHVRTRTRNNIGGNTCSWSGISKSSYHSLELKHNKMVCVKRKKENILYLLKTMSRVWTGQCKASLTILWSLTRKSKIFLYRLHWCWLQNKMDNFILMCDTVTCTSKCHSTTISRRKTTCPTWRWSQTQLLPAWWYPEM